MTRNNKGQFTQKKQNKKIDGFSVYNDSKGYEIMYIGGKEIKVHVYLWEKFNGICKPIGYEIHHKNGIKNDNRIENLEILTNSDHQKTHAGWIKENGEWVKKPCTLCGDVFLITEFYKRKGFTPAALCKKCHIKVTREYAGKNIEKTKEIKRKWYEKRRNSTR